MPPAQPTPLIPACARSSDGAQRLAFDALPFFKAADDQDLVELAKLDFAAGFQSELLFQCCVSKELRDPLLGYLALAQEQSPSLRLLVTVEREAAMRWLKSERPALHERIERRPEVEAAIERRLRALDSRS